MHLFAKIATKYGRLKGLKTEIHCSMILKARRTGRGLLRTMKEGFAPGPSPWLGDASVSQPSHHLPSLPVRPLFNFLTL